MTSCTAEAESSEDEEDLEAAYAEEVMDMAYALGFGEALDGIYTLWGTVTEIRDSYTSSKGVTLIMQVHEPQGRFLKRLPPFLSFTTVILRKSVKCYENDRTNGLF